MLPFAPLPDLRIVGAPIEARKTRSTTMSLENLRDSGLHPDVLAALIAISKQLTAQGVRHAVIGGIAVGVYGWPRATRDVDLLVGDEAWEILPTGERRERVQLPETVLGVAVDYLSIDVAGEFLNAALDHPFVSEGVPIAPVAVVVCTKLLRMAMRDQADIVELLKAGLFGAADVRRYLEAWTPMLVPRWDALVLQAEREGGAG
jgi:hypothetical protein